MLHVYAKILLFSYPFVFFY